MKRLNKISKRMTKKAEEQVIALKELQNAIKDINSQFEYVAIGIQTGTGGLVKLSLDWERSHSRLMHGEHCMIDDNGENLPIAHKLIEELSKALNEIDKFPYTGYYIEFEE